MAIKVFECIFLGTLTISCITSSVMMISSIFEDKKRTKREEERSRMEKERYDREMARFK